MRPSGEITERLLALRGGDRDALNQLVPLVYERLRQIAHARLAGRGPGASLDNAALVHEAYLKLVDSIEETAEALGVDARTVNRDWRAARALLYRALSGAEAT
jgi:hypothetical protein